MNGVMLATPQNHLPRASPLPAWAALLQRFYERAGLPLPRLQVLPEMEIPEPYKSLLVHSRDMTPTLETFYRQPMQINLLSREREDGVYLREVVLRAPDASNPVEYGVIRINLNPLPAPARQQVLEEQRPFGNILQTQGVPHVSRPQAFFRTEADSHMSSVLHLKQSCNLYGRSNTLLDSGGYVLAEVIEVLAPVPKS